MRSQQSLTLALAPSHWDVDRVKGGDRPNPPNGESLDDSAKRDVCEVHIITLAYDGIALTDLH
jgi:hypothetical protein